MEDKAWRARLYADESEKTRKGKLQMNFPFLI